MTFVGKILVILIMAFSLVFLGVSTVVFSTATNWKTKTEATKAELAKVQTKANDAETRAKAAQTGLDTAKAEHTKLVTERDNRIKDLEKKVSDAETQETAARSQLEVAQKNAQTALAEATARKAETDTLVETLNKAQAQANQFNAQNLDLTDQNRILERQKATAEQNAKDLRTFKAKTMAFLQGKGIDPEGISSADAAAALPQVEGRVNQVSANRSMEISIGSNDGLAVGQELKLFRTEPRPDYLGQVRIVAVYPNKAVADVVGKTVAGKRILEGDHVASSFSTR